MHTELQKDGITIFAVSEHNNEKLVADMHMQVTNKISPTVSLGIGFATEDEVHFTF